MIRRILCQYSKVYLLYILISSLLLLSLVSCSPSNKQDMSDQSQIDYSKVTLTDIRVSETIEETTKIAVDPQSSFYKNVQKLWITALIGGGLPAVDVTCYVYVSYEEDGQEFSVYASSERASDGERIAYPITLSNFDSDKIGSYVAKFYAGPDNIYITSAYFEVTE
jgi:hypothetical protein